MRKIVGTLVCGFLLLVQLPGCSGVKPSASSKAPIEETNKAKSAAELKARLEEIEKNGAVGSGIAGMKSGIESLENKELAEDLLKDLAKLETASGKAQVSEIAKRMASKL